jgi:uncharacterized protein (DUF4415 family)
MKKRAELKKFPAFRSDAEAERFVDEADLSEYDFSDFAPLKEVEARRKAGRPPLGEKTRRHVSLRLDPDVIEAFKSTGKGWQGRINDALRPAAAALASRPVRKFAAKSSEHSAQSVAAKALVRNPQPPKRGAARPSKPTTRSQRKG